MSSPDRSPISVNYYDAGAEMRTRDATAELSFGLFRQEVERAYESNDFYRAKYEEAGFHPDQLKSRSDISRIPLVTKEDLVLDVKSHPPFGKRLQVGPERVSLIIETSGSSGRGTEVHPLTLGDANRVYEAEAYGYFWAGARPGTVVMHTMPISTAGAGIFWHGALHLKTRSCVVNIGMYDAGAKLEILRKYRAEVLITTGPYLRRLEYVAEDLGLDLCADLRVGAIITLGEGASPTWIRARELTWGAKLFEHYGCTQRAFIGTCEYGMLRGDQRGMLHFLPHLCFVEVVDPETGQHVDPGEEGELVVTPLGSEATPVIRFATRDWARYLEASYCPCGRPFDGVESCSIGRRDDMIKVKGVNVWQNTVDGVVFEFDEVLEYQGEVRIEGAGRETAVVLLEFRPELDRPRRAALCDAIRTNLRQRTGLSYDVSEWPGSSMFEANAAAGQRKIRRWRDLRWEVQR